MREGGDDCPASKALRSRANVESSPLVSEYRHHDNIKSSRKCFEKGKCIFQFKYLDEFSQVHVKTL